VTVLPIAVVGDPVLRQRASEVDPAELSAPGLQRFIDDMIETKRAVGGAGLAANQVSRPVRIAVIEVDENTRARYPYKPPVPLTVIVNPWLEPLSDERLLVNEGCLSVPDLRMHYLDRNGAPGALEARGLTAGTFQHELDHLDGTLFLDRADPRSFSTWDQFERHGQAEFLRRIAPFAEGRA
jgi:peptide deformylase